ncbi:MAG: hypothetical protein JEZ06_17095 [Anaerolineaceae bacterium]|nr:hypothetical protein [Anaerolineaceae bacterium]
MENVSIAAGRDLATGEIAALMETCENDPAPAGARDTAIIALMYSGGLGRAEVVDLDISSFDPVTGRMVVIGYLIHPALLSHSVFLYPRSAMSLVFNFGFLHPIHLFLLSLIVPLFSV